MLSLISRCFLSPVSDEHHQSPAEWSLRRLFTQTTLTPPPTTTRRQPTFAELCTKFQPLCKCFTVTLHSSQHRTLISIKTVPQGVNCALTKVIQLLSDQSRKVGSLTLESQFILSRSWTFTLCFVFTSAWKTVPKLCGSKDQHDWPFLLVLQVDWMFIFS